LLWIAIERIMGAGVPYIRSKSLMRKPGRKLISGGVISIILTTVVVLMYSSCGEEEFNVFQPVAEPLALKGDEDAKLEQVMVLLDKKEYAKALKILEPMIADKDEDSNQARVLFAAARLGESQLDIWSVVKNIINAQSASQSGGGVDNVFDSFSGTVLGTGSARQAKIDALAESLTTLLEAPYPDERKIQNTACIFAGFLSVPTLADATSAMNGMQAALQQIRDAAGSGGTVCPNISLLDEAANDVIDATVNFNLILRAAQSCPFLNLDEAASLMNSVETSMNNLRSSSDKGCDALPNCPASLPGCASLFPPCVQQALAIGTSGAAANDGQISSCEVVLHCIDPLQCF
jgi:hypothetical protein